MTIIKLHPSEYSRTDKRLRSIGLMQGISSLHLDELIEKAHLCYLESGEKLFNQGDPARYWYLVVKGRIDTLREGYDGESRIMHQVGQGQLLAPIVMFMPEQEYPVAARASSPATLCRFQRQQLHSLCRHTPELALRILELAGQALCQRIDDVESLSSRNGPQRLAAYLYDLYLDQGITIELPLNHRELAAKLGLRPETLSRLLHRLQNKGILKGRRLTWEVTNKEQLKSLILSKTS